MRNPLVTSSSLRTEVSPKGQRAFLSLCAQQGRNRRTVSRAGRRALCAPHLREPHHHPPYGLLCTSSQHPRLYLASVLGLGPRTRRLRPKGRGSGSLSNVIIPNYKSAKWTLAFQERPQVALPPPSHYTHPWAAASQPCTDTISKL